MQKQHDTAGKKQQQDAHTESNQDKQRDQRDQAGQTMKKSSPEDVSGAQHKQQGGTEGGRDAGMGHDREKHGGLGKTAQWDQEIGGSQDEANRANEDTGQISKKSSNNDGAPMNATDQKEKVQQQGMKGQHGKGSEDHSWKDQKGKDSGNQDRSMGSASSKDQQGNDSKKSGNSQDRRGHL